MKCDKNVDRYVIKMQQVLKSAGFKRPSKQDSLRVITLQNQALVGELGMRINRKPKSRKEVVFG